MCVIGNEESEPIFSTERCLDVILNLLKVRKKNVPYVCLYQLWGKTHPIHKTRVPISLKSVLLEETPSPLEAAAFLLARRVDRVFSVHTLPRWSDSCEVLPHTPGGCPRRKAAGLGSCGSEPLPGFSEPQGQILTAGLMRAEGTKLE